jgi:arylsulfatase
VIVPDERGPYCRSTLEFDARNATVPPRFEVRAPEGAPNVLIVLIDDRGFGQSSAFSGPIHMPTVEALHCINTHLP